MKIEENKKPENPQAFAFGYGTDNYDRSQEGMSLRDYFANSAMQGICVNAGRNGVNFKEHEAISIMAYNIADAMLKQREQ